MPGEPRVRVPNVEGRGRSPEERQAAAEARRREREGVPEPGEESGHQDWVEGNRPRMSRHYGGEDVFARRRAIAIGGAAVLVIVFFLLLVGC
jgi:hypothetical protein